MSRSNQDATKFFITDYILLCVVDNANINLLAKDHASLPSSHCQFHIPVDATNHLQTYKEMFTSCPFQTYLIDRHLELVYNYWLAKEGHFSCAHHMLWTNYSVVLDVGLEA